MGSLSGAVSFWQVGHDCTNCSIVLVTPGHYTDEATQSVCISVFPDVHDVFSALFHFLSWKIRQCEIGNNHSFRECKTTAISPVLQISA